MLDKLIQTGLIMIEDVLDTYFRDSIEAGYIVVLQTAGRSASYNPHLHIMMTAGGLNSNNEWVDIKYIPFSLLHKKWQYHLFEMVKREVEGSKDLVDKLYRQYPKGIVAHIEMEIVPRKDKLANYLIKYVGSPPIALSRIIEYNGSTVKYWYNDHKTKKKEVVEVPVFQFIGRMVQHILPKGFKQVRYYGLHATCKAGKVRELLKEIFAKLGRTVKETVRKVKHYNYREGIITITGKDPFRCQICHTLMRLLMMYHPNYGAFYWGSRDPSVEVKANEAREREDSGLGVRRVGTSDSGNRGRDVLQLSLPPVWL